MSVAKAEVESELTAAWETLVTAVESLSQEEMEQPGVVDGWSVKDLLGHIAFWADKAAHDLRVVAAGRPAEVVGPGSDAETDEWNEREQRARAGKALADVREEWLASFGGAKAALAEFPAERLEENVKGRTVLERFAGDTYEHYREHAEQLDAWRLSLETTEA